jgi:hypothetical protein
MPLVTITALEKAIQRTLHVNDTDARQLALMVMDLFGYDDFIVDNVLNHEDRRLLYRLQLGGLVCTRREDVLLPDGRNWRIHYWMYQKHTIFPAEIQKKTRKTKDGDASSYSRRTVYSSLPETAWATRKAPLT